ncbi:MAG TPA: uroporphyrinogen-III synthase [Nakamurella sp.]
MGALSAAHRSAASVPRRGHRAGPLAGYTIGITAARRRHEFGAALERQGADVAYGPAIQIVPVANDDNLGAITAQLIAQPPDVMVATTAIGFRGWVEAADSWGVAEPFLQALSGATLLARGPKVVGAMHATGLFGEWSPPSESSSEVLERLLTMDLQGRRVVLQEHGEPLRDMVDALRAAGASVLEAKVYGWVAPADPGPLLRLCARVAEGDVHALTFTSAPAAVSFLQTARDQELLSTVTAMLQHEVMAVAVGPVTAAPLIRADIPVVQPGRARLGAMVREVSVQLPARLAQKVTAAGHLLEIRGTGVLVDGVFVTPGPTGMALLRKLSRHPGQVVSRAELVSESSGGGSDAHAVEVAVGRLRTALGDPRLLQTVVKRGYRLAFDPEVASTGRC